MSLIKRESSEIKGIMQYIERLPSFFHQFGQWNYVCRCYCIKYHVDVTFLLFYPL